MRNLTRKVKILIICLVVVLVGGVATAWHFLSRPEEGVLILKWDKPLILFGSILVNSTEVEKSLPEPLKPYIPPTLPNLALLRMGFASCHITTNKGTATAFLVFLSSNIEGTSVSQVTGGKLDFFVHEFVYKIYVDNRAAVDLLSELGLPVELTEISFDNSTVDSMQREMLIVTDVQGVTLLNVTLLRETKSTMTLPAEPKKDIDIKIGWVFGEEGNLKALRFKRDHNNGGDVYSLIEGIIEVSSSSPFFQAFGFARYDLATTLQQYLGSQGKVMVVLNGGESHFINP